jgi:hypothetical protein
MLAVVQLRRNKDERVAGKSVRYEDAGCQKSDRGPRREGKEDLN